MHFYYFDSYLKKDDFVNKVMEDLLNAISTSAQCDDKYNFVRITSTSSYNKEYWKEITDIIYNICESLQTSISFKYILGLYKLYTNNGVTFCLLFSTKNSVDFLKNKAYNNMPYDMHFVDILLSSEDGPNSY